MKTIFWRGLLSLALGLVFGSQAQAQAQAPAPLLRSLSLTFDTVRYTLGEQMLTVAGEPRLYFYYHNDDQVAELSDFALPEGPYDTLGGLVMQRLGRVPRKGDAVEVDGWVLRVLEVDGRRVDRVQLTPPPVLAEAWSDT